MKRDVLLTDLDGTSRKAVLELHGHFLSPPKLIVLDGKVYQHSGSGGTFNFYRQLEALQAVEHKELKSIPEAAGEVH